MPHTIHLEVQVGDKTLTFAGQDQYDDEDAAIHDAEFFLESLLITGPVIINFDTEAN